MSWFAKQVALPLAGFGVGWASWSYAENAQLIPRTYFLEFYLTRLKLERWAGRVAPSFVSANAFLQGPNEINGLISKVENELADYKAASEPPQLSFEEVLSQCAIPEQLEWLEEHAQDDIAYVFIADIFNAFAKLHRNVIAQPGTKLPMYSSVLCTKLVEKMNTGVIPFDVSSRVLAILATADVRNANLLRDYTIKVDGQKFNFLPLLMNHLRLYHAQQDGRKLGGNSVPKEDVELAVAQIVRSLNAVAYHPQRAWWAVWRPAATGPYPSLRVVASTEEQRAALCETFESLPSSAILGDLSLSEFVDNGKTFLKCDSAS